MRSNERAAAALGTGTVGAKLYAFAVGAALAGLGGALSAFRYPHVNFSAFDVFTSVNLALWTLIGGIGYVLGPTVGSLLAPSGPPDVLLERVIDLSGYVLLIATLLFRPEGQLHRRRRPRVPCCLRGPASRHPPTTSPSHHPTERRPAPAGPPSAPPRTPASPSSSSNSMHSKPSNSPTAATYWPAAASNSPAQPPPSGTDSANSNAATSPASTPASRSKPLPTPPADTGSGSTACTSRPGSGRASSRRSPSAPRARPTTTSWTWPGERLATSTPRRGCR